MLKVSIPASTKKTANGTRGDRRLQRDAAVGSPPSAGSRIFSPSRRETEKGKKGERWERPRETEGFVCWRSQERIKGAGRRQTPAGFRARKPASWGGPGMIRWRNSLTPTCLGIKKFETAIALKKEPRSSGVRGDSEKGGQGGVGHRGRGGETKRIERAAIRKGQG